jgi:hypothetical protein
MKKKIIVGLLALLLIGAVIGGLIWHKNKTAKAKGPLEVGEGSLTDIEGNVIEIRNEPIWPGTEQWGFNVYVNGTGNGSLVSIELQADGYILGVNKQGMRYVWKNGTWHGNL